MSPRTCFWGFAVACSVLLHGCESEGGAPPSVELFADPEVCDVPCEVVLDSGLIDSGGKTLTFTWELGDGPIAGDARLLHTFESAGAYEVMLTVSDGSESTSDRITVRAEPQPKASATIDETGGAVSLGAAKVAVPAEVAPEPVFVELTELPSMQGDAERLLGVGQFTALGSAYQVSTPLKTSTPINVAVTNPEAVGKATEDLAWLVRWVAQPVPRPDDPDILSRAPLASYGLVPVNRVDDDGMVHGEFFGRQRRFQLVTLAKPMVVDSFDVEIGTTSAEPSAKSDKAQGMPFVIIVFNETPPPGWEAYAEVVRGAVKASHDVLVTGKHFLPPEGTLTVVVGKMKDPKYNGYVTTSDFNTIYLNYTMFDSDKISKVLAHEFFHLIQNFNSNQASLSGETRQRDAWFKEGTAEWACDEVFDTSLDHYFATKWKRFEIPLNQEGYKDANEYQTVGFWKWAESENSDIISTIIADRYLLTHKFSSGNSIVENSVATDYLTSLINSWPEVDFLEFTHAARYAKDFDATENREGELWDDDPYLGPAKKVYADSSKKGEIEAGVAGDSEDNPLTIPFNLKQHLTADVHLVGSPNVEGDLHIRLPNTGSASIEAEILILDRATGDVEDVKLAPNLANGPIDFVSKDFDSDKEAVLLIVDPRWDYDSTDTPINGDVKYWVEDPCGSLPSNVIDIGPSDDLFVALTSAPAGSAVRLAPGTYAPPVKDFPAPEYGPISANVLVKDLMLIGAGEGQTVMVMNGDPYVGFGFKTYGNATIRNLTIDPRDSEPAFDCWDAKHVTLCNVTIQASSTTDYGILWAPWGGGSTSLGFFDSTLTSPAPENDPFGMFIQSCYVPPADVTVKIRNSEISGWGEGVSFDNGLCGSVSVNTDCEGFSNNLYYNVVDWNCSEGTCNPTELCP